MSLYAGSECASMVPVTGVGNTPPGSPYEDRAIAPAYSLTNGIHPGAAVPPAHSDLTYACTSVPIVTTTSYAMANAKIHPTTGTTPLQPPQSKLGFFFLSFFRMFVSCRLLFPSPQAIPLTLTPLGFYCPTK